MVQPSWRLVSSACIRGGWILLHVEKAFKVFPVLVLPAKGEFMPFHFLLEQVKKSVVLSDDLLLHLEAELACRKAGGEVCLWRCGVSPVLALVVYIEEPDKHRPQHQPTGDSLPSPSLHKGCAVC